MDFKVYVTVIFTLFTVTICLLILSMDIWLFYPPVFIHCFLDDMFLEMRDNKPWSFQVCFDHRFFLILKQV